MLLEKFLAHSLLPEFLLRWGIRRELADRLANEAKKSKAAFIEQMKSSPLAMKTDAANNQHYLVPPQFFQYIMGKRLKYSCCLWPEKLIAEPPANSELPAMLDEAEDAMLDLSLERAGVVDGESLLELGCGWGSLSLYAARKYPNCRITAVSNSSSQREFIESQVRQQGLLNLKVLTKDMNELTFNEKFNRIVSIEMFEHMRNYRTLLNRTASWLEKDGTMFVHIFTHKDYAYSMDDEKNSWMARNFFSGGMFPSYDIFSHFTEDMVVRNSWKVDGRHYSLTLEAWHRNSLVNRDTIEQIFDKFYCKGTTMSSAERWACWKIFFLACSELFKWNNGNEWFIGHYLLAPKSA